MRALLDTHAFIWWNTDDPRLSSAARSLIADGGNELLVSAATAWEIAIKYARGRLPLPEPPDPFVMGRMALHSFQPLPVEIMHAVQVTTLPPLHNDPFDRLLVAQAQVEGLPIVTSDARIAPYGVEVIW